MFFFFILFIVYFVSGHLPSALDSSYGTATNSIDPLFYPPNHEYNNDNNNNNNNNDNTDNELNILATSSYPYFLFPPNSPSSSNNNNNNNQYNYYQNNRNVPFALPATSSENLKYFYSYNITNTLVENNNEKMSTKFNNYNHNMHINNNNQTMHQQVNGTIISAPTSAPKEKIRWNPQHWDIKKRLEMGEICRLFFYFICLK
jgi:hypothetical protein